MFDSVWGVIPPPPERNTAWNKGRKCFHGLGAPNNLIRPWCDPVQNWYSVLYRSTLFRQSVKTELRVKGNSKCLCYITAYRGWDVFTYIGNTFSLSSDRIPQIAVKVGIHISSLHAIDTSTLLPPRTSAPRFLTTNLYFRLPKYPFLWPQITPNFSTNI